MNPPPNCTPPWNIGTPLPHMAITLNKERSAVPVAVLFTPVSRYGPVRYMMLDLTNGKEVIHLATFTLN